MSRSEVMGTSTITSIDFKPFFFPRFTSLCMCQFQCKEYRIYYQDISAIVYVTYGVWDIMIPAPPPQHREAIMANAPRVGWRGGSGQQYTYSVYDLDFVPAADQDGNYVFAKEIQNGWEAVYIGQGDMKTRRAAHLNEGCVTRNGATHFHGHLNRTESAGLAEESDMLDGNPEAYEPTGCNERPGG